MKIRTKNHRVISEEKWKYLETKTFKKFLLKEKSVENVKKCIRNLKKFEIFT